ncbi:hypothetical protein Z947_3065 [Sulfitobacter geojensis]|nr:hypothetical protein Z947_3065 [Sulfitobacter geojensis]
MMRVPLYCLCSPSQQDKGRSGSIARRENVNIATSLADTVDGWAGDA